MWEFKYWKRFFSKFSIWLYINFAFHWLDIGTDCDYYANVPMADPYLKGFILAFILIPFCFMFLMGLVDPRYWHCMVGTIEFYEVVNPDAFKDGFFYNSPKDAIGSMFFFMEEGPQLIVTTFNTMMIGTTMTYVQVLSPILSAMQMMRRGDKLRKNLAYFAFYGVILPMYIYVVRCFSKYEPCPETVCEDIELI